jgi:hypothetical protein
VARLRRLKKERIYRLTDGALEEERKREEREYKRRYRDAHGRLEQP